MKAAPWRVEEVLLLQLKELVRLKKARGEKTSVSREAHEALRVYLDRELAEIRNGGAV